MTDMFGRHTNLLIGAGLGLGMLYGMWYLLPLPWFVISASLLGYEAWTLGNDRPQDTISETIWRFSKRPVLPWLFGFFSCWLIMSGTIPMDLKGMLVLTFYMLLQGHFFFPKEE